MSAIRLFRSDDGAAPTQPATVRTVAQVIEVYLQNLRGRILAGSYTTGRLDRVEHILRDFQIEAGPLPLSEARQFHFTGWLTARASTWNSRTRQDAQGTVLTCFRWAEEEELIERSPFRKPRIKYVHQPKPPFTEAHYVALFRFLMRRDSHRRKGSRALRRALYFLWKTGARPGEMRNLRWDCIDWTECTATLAEHKTAHITGEARVIGLTARVMGFLRALKRQARGAEYVFRDGYNQPWSGDHKADDERGKNSYCRLYRRWADRAGLPKRVTSHSLRHGFCVRAIESGLSDRAIADQQGWTTTRMVSHYGKGTRNKAAHLRNVAESVERRKRGKPE